MTWKVANFVAFQIGWFACVLGAARGWPWLGPLYVLAFAVVQCALATRTPKRDAAMLLIAAIMGGVFDGALILLGFLDFPEAARVGPLTPVWMIALWCNLVLTLPASMAWLRERYWLSVVFGAVGGPLAYWAGARLGAVDLGDPTLLSLSVIAVEWALAMPALLYLAARLAPLPAVKSDATSAPTSLAEAAP